MSESIPDLFEKKKHAHTHIHTIVECFNLQKSNHEHPYLIEKKKMKWYIIE